MSAVDKPAPLALVPRTEERAGLARTSVSINGMDELFRFSAMLARLGTGIVPKAYASNESAIAACIVTGAELGIGAMESLRSIYIVDGKPQLAADLMMRIAIQRGVTIEWISLTDEVAHARFRRPSFPDHVAQWTIEDARRAGLAGKDVWKKYPRAMLRARCVSEALRAWAPDVLGAGVYVEGEFDGETGVGAAGAQPPTRAVQATVIRETPKPQDDPPKRTQMTQCETVEEMHEWCVKRGARNPNTPENRARVEAHARKIGANPAAMLDACGWLTPAAMGETPADPETGEVLEEPPQ